MTDSASQLENTPLEQLRALAGKAARHKHMLVSEARNQAVKAAATAWGDATVPSQQILAAARGLRGDVLADGLVSAWRTLPHQRRDQIIQVFSSEPDEGCTRAIYTSAGLVEQDPNAAVILLAPVRKTKEVLERLRSAFFRKNPERVAHFARADAPPFQVRKALQLLLDAAEETDPDPQRHLAEALLQYLSRARLADDTTFAGLLSSVTKQAARWSAPRRDMLVRFTVRLDPALATRLFPESISQAVADGAAGKESRRRRRRGWEGVAA